MSDWQPIETAPKDGTAVLLFGQFTNDFPVDARSRQIGQWFQGYSDRAWWVVNALPFYPTHWAPLLDEPKDRKL